MTTGNDKKAEDKGCLKGCLITIAGVVSILIVMAVLMSTDYFSWPGVHRANTIIAYESYLRTHPQGSHASEARTRVQELSALREEEWESIQTATTSALETFLPEYLDKYPNGSPAVDYFRKNRKKTIAGLRSADVVTRADYAGYVADSGARGVLFTPYLIHLLSDQNGLRIVSGPPIATETLGNEMGVTTVADQALHALTRIHCEEMLSGFLGDTPTEKARALGKDREAWEEWWADWWTKNRKLFH